MMSNQQVYLSIKVFLGALGSGAVQIKPDFCSPHHRRSLAATLLAYDFCVI
jgi:hypothetical protein